MSDGDADPQSERVGCPQSVPEDPTDLYGSHLQEIDGLTTLEEAWRDETVPHMKEDLYRRLQAAEMAYAIRYRVYTDLPRGNMKERRLVKVKTRSRMRTRLVSSRCIGPPMRGRAHAVKHKPAAPRIRKQPWTRRPVSFAQWRRMNWWLSGPALERSWRALPRGTAPSRTGASRSNISHRDIEA